MLQEGELLELPELPRRYFFRVSEGYFFGPTVKVQLRYKSRWWPFSLKHDWSWSTQEVLNLSSDAEVAVYVATRLRESLLVSRRRVDLSGLA